MIKHLSYITCFVILLNSCARGPEYSPIPKLTYIGASKNIMKQGNLLQDTVFLKFEFEDGDGDLGFTGSNPLDRVFDLFITDKRTGQPFDKFIFPSIPQQGINNGIRGFMTIKVFTTCCTIQPCDPFEGQANEPLPLEVFIFDRAKNKSNVVLVNNLELKCDI